MWLSCPSQFTACICKKIFKLLLYVLRRGLFVNHSDLYRVPECLNQTKLLPTRWKIIQVKRSQAHIKSQSLTKNKIRKSILIHLMYSKFFQACSCLIFWVPRWTGLSMMVFTIDFLKWHLKCENILECELANACRERKMQGGNCWEWGFWD